MANYLAFHCLPPGELEVPEILWSPSRYASDQREAVVMNTDYLNRSLGFFDAYPLCKSVCKKTLKSSNRRGLTRLSPDFLKEAVSETPSSRDAMSQFYKIQSLQTLGEETNRVMVPIWIAPAGDSEYTKVASAWIEHIQRAIDDINFAAPGLCLYTTYRQSTASIKIAGTDEESCYTIGNYILNDGAEIYLDHKWSEMKRTSCHELLHAIGFHHEHQRSDRDHSVHVKTDDPSYKKRENILGLTRFDPFSIMLYPEDEEMSRNRGDAVWFTKPFRELNREMSELDKVGLNNLYRPCKGPQYSPTKHGKGVTGLWYCGRYFGVQSPFHDGCCGPTNGPNCPACRVLQSVRGKELWIKGKWQGWTGEVYCGRFFGVRSQGHDGYCGPNNGPSCPECYEELLKGA